jgi:hypothetical protein
MLPRIAITYHSDIKKRIIVSFLGLNQLDENTAEATCIAIRKV